LGTPTWRASSEWAVKNGYTEEQVHEANANCVKLLRELLAEQGLESPIAGTGGPRHDAYKVTPTTVEDAEAYHSKQIAALKAAGADFMSFYTMN